MITSFDSLFSRAGLGHLGKGWIVHDTTTRRLPYPYWANGLFYPGWNRLYWFTRDVVELTFFKFEFFRVLQNQFESSFSETSPKISSKFRVSEVATKSSSLLDHIPTIYSLSVAVWLAARHWPDCEQSSCFPKCPHFILKDALTSIFAVMQNK